MPTQLSSDPPNPKPADSDSDDDTTAEPTNDDEDFKSEPESDSDSDSESRDSDDDEDGDDDEPPLTYVRPGDEPPGGAVEDENSPEANIRLFDRVLNSKRARREMDEEDSEYIFHEDLFDFPEDPENWQEEDLRELWADAPLEMTKPGWDPKWADEEDWEIVEREIEEGRDPPIQPFYVPFRRPFPVIPDNHHDIANAKAVIEELDRIEEFLTWVSYIFPDGSS